MNKQQLRKIYKQKRDELSATDHSKMDDLILIQFQRLSFEDIHVVLSFWPMEDRGEMNTHLYTSYLVHLIPGVQICYPLIDTSSNYMQAVKVEEDTDLEENKFGITEPANGEEVDPKEIDMILIPLFAFDKNGNRVGYGKGYYDRFLKQCEPGAVKVGLSYFDAVDLIDDANQFDVPLNYCITPHKVYEF